MTTLYLNSLEERLRPVARLVFPSDIERCVRLSHMNRYTRLYLRRIIELARNEPFNLIITNKTLAKLFHVRLNKFLQWFHHNASQPKVFHRVRYFLREIIIAIIIEDRGELYSLVDEDIVQESNNQPSEETMIYWKKLTKVIRKETQHREPVIETLIEAEEIIGWIQDAQYSSYSCESDDEDVDYGENPEDNHCVSEEAIEPCALNGSSAILTDFQMRETYKNISIKSDILDHNHNNDTFVFDVDHL